MAVITADGSIGTKTTSYAYDANGNMSSGDGRSITWSAFNKPVGISQGANSATLGYGPERQLLTRIDDANGQVTSTVHVGGGYEKVTLPGGAVEERHTVGGNTLVTYTNRTAGGAGTIKTRYLLKDHLGSVTAITDEAGDEVEAFSFDAWGKRRAPTLAQLQGLLGNWSTLNSYQRGNLTIPALLLGSALTERGFTGHRQLDGVGLIHMGGRVYDAEIGRFLSADPFTGDSTNLQALNRYTYVENNPLSYTDPSGYFLKKLVKGIGRAIGKVLDGVVHVIKVALQKIGRVFGEVPGLSAIIGAMACGVTGPGVTACLATFGKVMMGLNAAITTANGGTIGQVLRGAAVGLISGQIGAGMAQVFGDSMGSQLGVGLFMGGAVAKAQGGKFIDGVKGAAIGMGVSYGVMRIALAAENKAESEVITTASREKITNKIDPEHIVRPEIDFSVPYDSYEKAIDALNMSILEAKNLGNRNWEYGGIIVSKDNNFYNSTVVTSRQSGAIYWDGPTLKSIHNASPIVALHHYHPLGLDGVAKTFSKLDIKTFKAFRSTFGEGFRGIYLVDKYGARKYDGTTGDQGVSCSRGFASC